MGMLRFRYPPFFVSIGAASLTCVSASIVCEGLASFFLLVPCFDAIDRLRGRRGLVLGCTVRFEGFLGS